MLLLLIPPGNLYAGVYKINIDGSLKYNEWDDVIDCSGEEMSVTALPLTTAEISCR